MRNVISGRGDVDGEVIHSVNQKNAWSPVSCPHLNLDQEIKLVEKKCLKLVEKMFSLIQAIYQVFQVFRVL